MHKSRSRVSRWLGAVGVISTFILAACGGSPANSTPTLSVDAIYTSAFQTFEAQQATQLALTPPTDTPSPTSAATLPPPSPLPTISFLTPTQGPGPSACDNATYVKDVTIPDGTVMAPGQQFEKKWQMLNSGTCTWSGSYSLAFDSGDLMGGSPSFIQVPVPPGNQTTIAVELTAPTAAGTYTGNWRMKNAGGAAFGNLIYVTIKVGSGGATVTPGPSPTPGAGAFTISGSAGAADVTLTYTGSTSGTTTSDSNGNYAISVPSGWSGTITPSKGKPGHWVFSPSSKTFTNVTSDKSFDFVATPVTPTPGDTPTPVPTPT